MTSGVACSAATMRSPSFSRSSSSTTTTIWPAAIAAMASAMVAVGTGSVLSGNGQAGPANRPVGGLEARLQEPGGVFGDHVPLDVDRVPGRLPAQGGDRHGVRDHGHREAVVGHV